MIWTCVRALRLKTAPPPPSQPNAPAQLSRPEAQTHTGTHKRRGGDGSRGGGERDRGKQRRGGRRSFTELREGR